LQISAKLLHQDFKIFWKRADNDRKRKKLTS